MSGDESYVPSVSELVSGDHAPSNIFDEPEDSPDVEDYAGTGEKRSSPETTSEFEDLREPALPIDYTSWAQKAEAKAAKLWDESQDVNAPYEFIADKLFTEYDFLTKFFDNEEHKAEYVEFGQEFYKLFTPVGNYLQTIRVARGGYKFVPNPDYEEDDEGYGISDFPKWLEKKCSPGEADAIMNEYQAKLMEVLGDEDTLQKLIAVCETAKRKVRNVKGVSDYEESVVDLDEMAEEQTDKYLWRTEHTPKKGEAIAKLIGKDYDFLQSFFENKDNRKHYDQFGHEFFDMVMDPVNGVLMLLEQIKDARNLKQEIWEDDPQLDKFDNFVGGATVTRKSISPSKKQEIISRARKLLKPLENKKGLLKLVRVCERAKHNYEVFVTKNRGPKKKSKAKAKQPKKSLLSVQGFVGPAPKKGRGRRATVKDVAYFQSLTEDQFLGELTKNQGAMTKVWKPLMGEINATLVNTSTEADIAQKFREVVFPKWFEKYGRTGTPQDLYRMGRGGPVFENNAKAIRSWKNNRQLKIWPEGRDAAYKDRFFNVLKAVSASYEGWLKTQSQAVSEPEFKDREDEKEAEVEADTPTPRPKAGIDASAVQGYQNAQDSVMKPVLDSYSYMLTSFAKEIKGKYAQSVLEGVSEAVGAIMDAGVNEDVLKKLEEHGTPVRIDRVLANRARTQALKLGYKEVVNGLPGKKFRYTKTLEKIIQSYIEQADFVTKNILSSLLAQGEEIPEEIPDRAASDAAIQGRRQGLQRTGEYVKLQKEITTLKNRVAAIEKLKRTEGVEKELVKRRNELARKRQRLKQLKPAPKKKPRKKVVRSLPVLPPDGSPPPAPPTPAVQAGIIVGPETVPTSPSSIAQLEEHRKRHGATPATVIYRTFKHDPQLESTVGGRTAPGTAPPPGQGIPPTVEFVVPPVHMPVLAGLPPLGRGSPRVKTEPVSEPIRSRRRKRRRIDVEPPPLPVEAVESDEKQPDLQARHNVAPPRVHQRIDRQAFGDPSEEEKKEEEDAREAMRPLMRGNDMRRLRWNRFTKQFTLASAVRHPRTFHIKPTMIRGSYTIPDNSYQEVVYVQPPPSSAYNNRFLNMDPAAQFIRQTKQTDPLHGAHSHFWTKLGEYVQISAQPHAIHFRFRKRKIPDKAINILISRIIEHAQSNQVIKPRLLNVQTRGGKKILSMMLDANQLRTGTADSIEEIFRRGLRRSKHFILKQDSAGGVLHNRVSNDNVLM